MTRTVEGGKSPRQNAAIRGRKLIQEELQRKKDFESLREGGNKPSLNIGPLLLKAKRT